VSVGKSSHLPVRNGIVLSSILDRNLDPTYVSESPKDCVSHSNDKVEHVRAPREVTDVEVAERIENFASTYKSGVRGLRHQISDIDAPSSRLQSPVSTSKTRVSAEQGEDILFWCQGPGNDDTQSGKTSLLSTYWAAKSALRSLAQKGVWNWDIAISYPLPFVSRKSS